MKKFCLMFALIGSSLLSNFASAGTVQVTWQDTDKYADIRPTNESRENFRKHVFQELGLVFEDLAKKLPDEVQWKVTVTDLDLAGEVRPVMMSAGNDIRIIKDIYWPRMSLSYVMTDGKGSVVAEGKEDISDMSFMMIRPINMGNGSFPYEAKMLEDWFRKQLKSQKFPSK